jgi:hypothetical protein
LLALSFGPGCGVGSEPSRPGRVRLDRSFGDRGLIALDGARSGGSVVARAQDGSVFVGGDWIPPGERSFDWTLMRFTEHGDAYRTYNANVAAALDGWGGSIDDIVVMADGSALVAGARARPADPRGPEAVIVRFTREGRVDRRFGRSGVLTVHLEGTVGPSIRLFPQRDLSVLVTRFQFTHPESRFDVLRIDERGRADDTYARRTRLPAVGHPVLAMDRRGRLVGAETDTSENDIQIFRLDRNGLVDDAFGERATRNIRRLAASVTSYYRGVAGMTIDRYGRIVVVMRVGHDDSKLVRLLDDGAIDQGFGRDEELVIRGVVLDLVTDPAGGGCAHGCPRECVSG